MGPPTENDDRDKELYTSVTLDPLAGDWQGGEVFTGRMGHGLTVRDIPLAERPRDPQLSEADLVVPKRLNEVGELMGNQLLDT